MYKLSKVLWRMVPCEGREKYVKTGEKIGKGDATV